MKLLSKIRKIQNLRDLHKWYHCSLVKDSSKALILTKYGTLPMVANGHVFFGFGWIALTLSVSALLWPPYTCILPYATHHQCVRMVATSMCYINYLCDQRHAEQVVNAYVHCGICMVIYDLSACILTYDDWM